MTPVPDDDQNAATIRIRHCFPSSMTATQSGTSITFTGTASDVVSYVCVGK